MYTPASWQGFRAARRCQSSHKEGVGRLFKIAVGSIVKSNARFERLKGNNTTSQRQDLRFMLLERARSPQYIFRMQVRDVSQEVDPVWKNVQMRSRDFIQTDKQLDTNISHNHKSHSFFILSARANSAQAPAWCIIFNGRQKQLRSSTFWTVS